MALKTKVHFENLDIDRQNRKTNSTHVIASTSWKHFVPRNLFGGLEQRDGQMHARWYCNILTAGQATYSTLTSPPVSPRLRETSTEQLTPFHLVLDFPYSPAQSLLGLTLGAGMLDQTTSRR